MLYYGGKKNIDFKQIQILGGTGKCTVVTPTGYGIKFMTKPVYKRSPTFQSLFGFALCFAFKLLKL